MRDDGFGVLVEGGEPLLDGVNVVIDPAGGLSSVQETFGHSLVADFKVQDLGTRGDLLFEFFALKFFRKIHYINIAILRLFLVSHTCATSLG